MIYPHDSITDMDIQALVDQQLSWEDEKDVRAHLESHPAAKIRHQELMQQKKLLQKWWQGISTRHH